MFTVIIPVYNEGEIIIQNTEDLLAFLDELKVPYEVILCSNGSTDSTEDEGRWLGETYDKVKFLSLPKRGVGLAFKEGVKNARHENLVSLDMDLSTDLKFIPGALKLLDNHHIIIGSKKVGSQQRSFFRLILSGGFIFLVKLFLAMDYQDYSIGAKAYKKSVIEKYVDEIGPGSSYVIEIIARAKSDGHKIAEIPVHCKDTRKSKFSISGEVVHRFKNLVSLFYTMRIKRIFSK